MLVFINQKVIVLLKRSSILYLFYFQRIKTAPVFIFIIITEHGENYNTFAMSVRYF